MWNRPTQKQLAKIPKLYATEDVPFKDKKIYMHFFVAGCDWYISESDGNDMLFGFAILNSDLYNAEWGYVSFRELLDLKIGGFLEVDREIHWKVQKAGEIDRIKNLF
jgi:hypothetical protein